MTYRIELGHIVNGLETVVSTHEYEGTPRLGEYMNVRQRTGQGFTDREYRGLGIEATFERVTVL